MGRSVPDAVREEMVRQTPLGRTAEPREIADAILFLCSELASYVTGHTLHVSGGATMA